MKGVAQLVTLQWLLILLTSKGLSSQRVDCQWGSYGSWSECDSCTKSQMRSRVIAVFAQFGGSHCYGSRTETRPCETTKGCPLEDGCGDRFRCRSGKCISQSLVCNGDQDCEEDGLDEHCPLEQFIACKKTTLPPNIEALGRGFDAVSERWKESVINTKSFGGQCRTIYSGVHNTVYRLPISTLQYSFLVKVQNDFSDDMFVSKWHYAKDIVRRETVTGTTKGFRNYDYHETVDNNKVQKLLVLENEIEVAQFQSSSYQYLPVSESLWKALVNLPSVYSYGAYRKVLERFGTHYVSEGSLGGSLKMVVKLDEETEKHMIKEESQHNECTKIQRWFLFIPITHETCDKGHDSSSSTWGSSRKNNLKKVDVRGGGVQHIAPLKTMSLDDPSRNWELYSNWAHSIQSFPGIIKKKLRPLYELVKEVQCASVKKHFLRKAMEEYLAESAPCHCKPCSNNGMVFMDGDECKCICKPGTSGLACEVGTEAEGQHGVIHGSWTCWSAWSSCSGARRSRHRSCTNPAPQNGGQFCIGDSSETSNCDDEDLLYLKTMEPQCFDQTLMASQQCKLPPALINGYILHPKDIYLVGSKVEYTCTNGFHLVGQNTIECAPDETWSGRPGLCSASACKLDALADGVIASPIKDTYDIGAHVTLSCPPGRQLQGEATVTCDPSLNFSPDPADIRCSTVVTPKPQAFPLVQCEPWKKPSRGNCVCKIPFECSPSLEVCASTAARRKSVLLTVCKMHSLRCLGKEHEIVEDSSCTWPERNTKGCTNCHMWETCDDEANECRCKDSADCSTPEINVCVRVGDDMAAENQTMSECEAGLRRCNGETVSLVSILPCVS